MPFTVTSTYAGKYGQKTNQKQTLLKLNTTQKSKQHITQQNKTYPGSVAFHDTRPAYEEMGLFYNAPEPTWGARMSK